MLRRGAILTGIACTAFSAAACFASETVEEKPRIYCDPKGRFSFHLSGDWVRIRPMTARELLACSSSQRKSPRGEKLPPK